MTVQRHVDVGSRLQHRGVDRMARLVVRVAPLDDIAIEVDLDQVARANLVKQQAVGIDQVLPYAGNPRLYEPYAKDASQYVELAEAANGLIAKPVEFPYIWGDALKEFERMAPDVWIINLETSVTQSEDYWRNKGINYRMHPKNIPCITSAAID